MEAKRSQELKSWILRSIFLAPNFLPQKISLSLPIKSSWKILLPLPKSRHLLPAPKYPTVYNEHLEEKKQYQCKRFTLSNVFWEEESMQCFTLQYKLQGRVWMQFLALGDTSLIKQLLFTSTTMKTENSSSICANVSLWTMQCFTLHINALREVVWMQFLVSSSSSCLPPPPLRSTNPRPVFLTSANFYILHVFDKTFYHNRLWQKRLCEIMSSFFVFAKVFLQPPQSCHFSTPWQRKRKLMP